MSKNVSKEDLRKVNRIYKVVMFSLAAALAIGALIYNPFHLATAGLIVAYTLSSGFVENKDGGINYERLREEGSQGYKAIEIYTN